MRDSMKKSMKLLIATLLALCIFCMAGCNGRNGTDTGRNSAKTYYSTETDAVEKMFPSLEGIKAAEWEQVTMGSGREEVPGPTDYRYQGYITLTDEAAEKFASEYSFDDAAPDVELETVSEREGQWKFSNEFNNDMKPEYYSGKMWIDGNTIFFSITTM